ncbi:hypothetical protein KDW_59040 [Dictyobacter vulcani]|uniref:Methyltransferase domain-containing protein n=1 Tax=Dictyobacter vulcani TaxID=2607529 RepID=A0A5J4KX80_9CHLR|nr:class I SAM-dependent methyltransferase [Dictyobacter vulcani]GER91742.1 hypothetical protein KDW_59040 [Dictyobacter vulcani]
MDYQQAIANLKVAYNSESASKRNQEGKQDWKLTERQSFLDLLQLEGKSRLLEVGAGTGQDSLFFQQHGMQVISTDLSPAMVALCREKGLEAHVMDFLSLDFPPESFDALYALNCLLHVPTSALPAVLEKLRGLLHPGGLFFLGVYGGIEKEGISDKDWHQPPRYFSRHTDEFMQQAVAPYFEIVSFKSIPYKIPPGHFNP